MTVAITEGKNSSIEVKLLLQLKRNTNCQFTWKRCSIAASASVCR